MTTDAFIPGLLSDLPLTGRSLAAVDLGFGTSKTCGIAIAGMDDAPKPILKSFGGCVSHIASLVTDGKIDALIARAGELVVNRVIELISPFDSILQDATVASFSSISG